MAELAALIHRRGLVKSKVSRFNTYLDKIPTNPDTISQLPSRLEAFKSTWTEFETIQSQIETLLLNIDDGSGEDQDAERESFEDRYFALNARADALIGKPTEGNETSINPFLDGTTISTNNMSQFNIKLPQINLPEFDGSYDSWTQFRDTFDALIDTNSNLSNIQKFYYLQSALKGDASQVIQSLQVTDVNYSTAWRLLAERFENKKAIIHSHIKGIYELPSISKESHVQLRNFLDSFQKHFRSLKNLGESVDSWDTLLLFLLLSKLDVPSKREWEIHTKQIISPKIEDFTSFLIQRCQVLEAIDTKLGTSNAQNSVVKKQINTRALVHLAANQNTCPLCKETHFIYNCSKFLKLSPYARLAEIKRLKLCINCFRMGHTMFECKSTSCKVCSKKHNTLLHAERRHVQQSNPLEDANKPLEAPVSQKHTGQALSTISEVTNQSTQSHCTTSSHCSQQINRSITLLSTATVIVQNASGETLKCRCMLDNGSQSNFITENTVSKLNLNTSKINLPVSGINKSVTKISKCTEAHILSVDGKYQNCLHFLIVRNITDLVPQRPVDVSHLTIPHTIKLADPNFNQPSQVDMLLGANVFFDLLSSGQISLGKNKPVLYNTKLGWIISGEISSNPQQSAFNCFLVTNNDLQTQLEHFWKVEEISQPRYTKEEQECENHFVNTFKRNESNRFVVKLPLRDDFVRLGDSREIALQRLYSLEHRLSKNSQLRTDYSNFLSEYERLEHMSRIPEEQIDNQPSYYLPHHCVEKQASTTTKLRVVFDASCKTTSGLSLNDVLKIGPCIQSDLCSILVRFRQHNFVLTGDISKMYRQVEIDESQRDFQRILWRENQNESVRHYRLNTITYGTSSASFLATRCLVEIANEVESSSPIESEIIKSDFYMDDLLTGAQNVQSLIAIKNNIERILNSSGFQLRKFMSNDAQVVSNNQNGKIHQYIISQDQDSKTLGVSWNATTDTFNYTSVKLFPISITKRTILSTIAQIFDPLGLLQPVIIKAKIILQELWRLKIDWDDHVPKHLHDSWKSFSTQLEQINSIRVNRQVTIREAALVHIHGFCDASERAYGACVYIWSQDTNGKVEVNLLCAKSRVAPLKVLTIPRLELCGALLLSKLIANVISSWRLKIHKTFCWTDSTIVLSWLKSESTDWKIFVANRVAEIQQLIPESVWLHVPSAENPADILSRGSDLGDLNKAEVWWHGPSYLTQDTEHWPKLPTGINMASVDTERKRKEVLVFTSTEFELVIERFSNFVHMQRVLAYVFRFIKNSRLRPEERSKDNLTIDEINSTTTKLIKHIQSQCFVEDLQTLKSSNTVKPSSKLASLTPFLDKEGIIRVGGRLKNSNLSYDNKHQILIPKNHHISKLIIRYYHIKNGHSGAQTTLSFVRQIYWPIDGKNQTRKLLRKCVTCFRARPVSETPRMGELPSVRVTPNRAFLSCGIDYAGPFLIKDGITRNRKNIKAYICIFICLFSKALHIEVVTDLTTESFLRALSRFVSRRGLCGNIYSDNATNFRGADRELVNIFNHLAKDPKCSTFLTQSRIRWHFVPARSAHFGGLWEAAVKSVKSHLKKIVSNTEKPNLTHEEFLTFLCQIESVLNSRPLFPISNDPNDLEVLTPGHFIIGAPLNALPPSDGDIPASKLSSRYKHIQLKVRHFWSRWSRDYLHNMQQRTKWRFNKQTNELMGAVVLLREDNLPPAAWSLGRIVDVHPGTDGIVRVVSVKTRQNVFKRAVVRVCLLPIEQ